jgi:hypothetical protein
MATKRLAKPQISKDERGYQWELFSDFSNGLWQRGDDRECPRNGLLSLTDAYPLPTGGLRAWGTWQPMTMTGITNNSYILGVWSIGGVDPLAGIYCCTLECDPTNQDNSTFRLYKLSGTSNGGTPESSITGGTWNVLMTITALKAFSATQHLTPYRFTTGANNTYAVFFNLGVGTSAAAPVADTTLSGIYRSDGTTGFRDFYFPWTADCFGHQLSLMFTAIEPGGQLSLHNQIAYTNVASDAQPTTVNAFFPLPNFSSPITWVSPVEPSDLIVAKSEIGLALIQGDITNPIQRQISFAHAVSVVRPVNTDTGLAISVSDDSVYVWTGSQLKDIANQLLGNPTEPTFFGSATAKGFDTNRFDIIGEPTFRVASWGHTGQMDFGEYTLFAGNTYCWDERTESWYQFTSNVTRGEGQPARYCVDRVNQRVYQAYNMSMQSSRQLLWWENLQETDYHRASSYTFTLPLIYSDHGFTQLREIEYYLALFAHESVLQVRIESMDHEGNITVQDLEPRTVTLPGVAPAAVRGDLRPSGASTSVRIADIPGTASMYWKITTTLSALNHIEAPMLEKVMVATAPLAGRLSGGN